MLLSKNKEQGMKILEVLDSQKLHNSKFLATDIAVSCSYLKNVHKYQYAIRLNLIGIDKCLIMNPLYC
jgi:hypothetical protein